LDATAHRTQPGDGTIGDERLSIDSSTGLIGLFILSQLLYLMASAVDFHLYSLPVNRADMSEAGLLGADDHPYIVLFHPILDELKETMRTTLTSLGVQEMIAPVALDLVVGL
jgi:hypothetical protein